MAERICESSCWKMCLDPLDQVREARVIGDGGILRAELIYLADYFVLFDGSPRH